MAEYLNQKEKSMLAITLLLLFSSGILLGLHAKLKETTALEERISRKLTDDFNRIKVSLKIDVTRANGTLKSSFYDEEDLILTNFLTVLKGIFTDGAGAEVSVSVTDTGGVSRSIVIRQPAPAADKTEISDDDIADAGGYIRIGTGTNAAARADYNLQTAVESYTAVIAPSYSSTTGNLTFAAAVAVTADRTITEAGFFCQWHYTATGATMLMLLRDVFSGISVSSSDTCTVTYVMDFSSTGFNNNLGYMLQGYFTYSVIDSTRQGTMTDTSGTSRTVNFYGRSYSTPDFLLKITANNPKCGIRIGTDSSTADRANYTLGAAVETLTSTGTPSIATGNLTVAAVVLTTASNTITEAGCFLNGVDDTDTARLFMLWRTTFEGVGVSSGGTITITFIIITIVLPLTLFKKSETTTI